MSFGSRLREARQAKNMNQKELGALIGVTGNAVSNYENGTSSPNDHILLKIFNVLEIEPNFLFQDSFSYTTKAPAEQELSKEAYDIAIRFDGMDDSGKALVRRVVDYIALAEQLSPAASKVSHTDGEIAAALRGLTDSQSDIPEAQQR